MTLADVDGGATDAEDDDVTVVDPEEDDDSCEFIFEEIDVDEKFDWAKHLVLEEDLESDDEEDSTPMRVDGTALRKTTGPFTPPKTA